VKPLVIPNDLIITIENGAEFWEVPHQANSRYLSHDYFRYIGKFPPQLAREFIRRYAKTGRPILDPMCGGGTVLLEAKIAGYDAIGYDVNPVSELVSRVVTTGIEPSLLEDYTRCLVAKASETLPSHLFPLLPNSSHKFSIPDLLGNESYFAEENLRELAMLKSHIDAVDHPAVRDFYTVAFLSIMRQTSQANVKKMNTEIDENKARREVWPTFYKKLKKMIEINRGVWMLPQTHIQVKLNDARNLLLSDETVPLVIVHPPYLTNTAFSESVQLPLAWLGIKHTQIWKKELRARGSYLREPDGLQKYLVDWHGILSEIRRVLEPNGICVVVVGDGQMDYVRIPVGSITVEFANDIGFKLESRLCHRINNNTGMTQSRKMRDQHIIVLRK
jgi:site-specific DNA-methyltransferase (cytosine-N4-specific)